MLILNEKKIRKGKPIGLPYVGSKKKVAKKIVEIIKQNFGTDKPIYDIFCGGGAITAECILNGLEAHYNDLNKDITDAFERVISQDRKWIKTLIVSRDEFFEIKAKENKTTDDFLKLLINSFGNNKKDYLYSKEISDLKYKLAKEIPRLSTQVQQMMIIQIIGLGDARDWAEGWRHIDSRANAAVVG